MKIAISATGNSLDASVDPRFGRCPFFVLVETDDMSVTAVDNQSSTRGSGAGIGTAQTMAQQGVAAVLTGNCGPNAHRTLNAAGIDVITGCSGIISSVVDQFVAGAFAPSAGPSVNSHFGMGRQNR